MKSHLTFKRWAWINAALFIALVASIALALFLGSENASLAAALSLHRRTNHEEQNEALHLLSRS